MKSVITILSEAKGFQSVPVEIELSEEAPVELLKAASLTNFLNGYEMDDNVRAMCGRWGLDAEKISSDRELYALQIQTMRDHLQDAYADKIMDLASWIMGETTAGMGSVMAAMTGDYTKYGNPRKRE